MYYIECRSPCKGAILSGKWQPIVKHGNSAMSYAKTALPIEMQFGTLSWVGPGNYVLDGGVHWHNVANMTEPYVCSGDAAL